MKKDAVRGIAALGIVAVVYILISFLIPFSHKAPFWIAFVFGLAAIAVAAAAIYIAFVKQPDAKSRFYGFPIARIGVLYGVIQIAASVLAMALAAWIPGWIVALLFVIALGAALIGLIGAEVVVEEIQKQDVKLKKDVSLMRSLQSKVNHMASQFDNSAVRTLAEEFRYSDPVSNDAIADVEADLEAAVDELQRAIIDDDKAAVAQLCRKTSAVLAERNRLCKLNKAR